MAVTGNFITTASGSLNVTTTATAETTISPTQWIELKLNSCIRWTCESMDSVDKRVKGLFDNRHRINLLRKDLFKESSISPIEAQYSQRKMMNHCVIPAKRNFKGIQARRL